MYCFIKYKILGFMYCYIVECHRACFWAFSLLFDFSISTAGRHVYFVQSAWCQSIGVSRGGAKKNKEKKSWILLSAVRMKARA